MRLSNQQKRDLAFLDKLVKTGIAFKYAVQLDVMIRNGEFTFANTRATILRSMAKTAFNEWWYSEQENKKEDRRSAQREGEKIEPWMRPSKYDTPPKIVPAPANAWARKVMAEYEAKADVPIELLYWMAENAEGHHSRESTPEEFGLCLAMTAVGAGISWFDSHPDFEPLRSVRVHREYYP